MSTVVEHSVVLEPKTATGLDEPHRFSVIIFNDDFTPMEFVVRVLEGVFHLDHTKATAVMMQVHQQGSAVCGVYTRDIAETKVNQVIELARKEEHPLMCRCEEI